MALTKTAKNQYRVTLWNGNTTTGDKSDAVYREFFALHSLQIYIGGTASVSIQLSNVESPAENTDNDWVTFSTVTSTSMVPINQLFRWIRVKRNASTAPVTAVLLSGSRVNT